MRISYLFLLLLNILDGYCNVHLVKTKNKHFLVETKVAEKKGSRETSVSGTDYELNGVKQESEIRVNRGSNAKLRCESPRQFDDCKFFSPTDELYEIGISGGSSYAGDINPRVDSLITVVDYDPTKVCGIYVQNVSSKDDGSWKCEMEYNTKKGKRYKGKTILLSVNDNTTNTGSKCSQYEAGDMKQKDVVGCGGAISMRCKGGCIKIHKILYSCEEQDESNEEQLETAKELCDEKEECNIKASREVFGDKECPETSDNEMLMWVVYSCDGGEDSTYLTGPNTCPTDNKTVPLPGNPYGNFNSCERVEDCRLEGKMCHGLKNQYADCLCKKGQCDIKGKVWPSSPSNNINNPAPSPKNLHGYGGYWPSGLLKPDTHIKPFGFHSANYLSGLNSLQKHTDKKKFALDERTVVNDMPNPYRPWK